MTTPLPTQHSTPPDRDAPIADVRLIACDMDGTLLDGEGRIPDALWPLLDQLDRHGVLFCPASGRQYATLARQFRRAQAGRVFIAENGTYVVRDGRPLSCDPLDPASVPPVLHTIRGLAAEGVDLGAVLCGKKSAYVERTDPAFLGEAATYYARLTPVDDLTAVDDEFLKIAIFDFGSAERRTAPALAPFTAGHQVVVSGAHWIDIMSPTANKGAALRRLQSALGITPAQTMAFGDYLNDLEMLDAADWSFAMANAHPDILRRALYQAPSHQEHGVIQVLTELVERVTRTPAAMP